MKDNENLELENANLDNENAEQSEKNPDNDEAKDVEQEGKADTSGFQTKAEPEVDTKVEARNKAKEGIINSFVQKVATGDVEIDAVPEWARGDVNSQLGAIIAPKETTNNFSKDDVVAQAKSELKFEMKLESLANSYSQEEVDLITAQFQTLKEVNPAIDQSEAVDYAIFKLGLSNKEDRQTQTRIKNAGLPPQGKTPTSQGVYTEAQMAEMDQTQYEKVKGMIKRGEATIK